MPYRRWLIQGIRVILVDISTAQSNHHHQHKDYQPQMDVQLSTEKINATPIWLLRAYSQFSVFPPSTLSVIVPHTYMTIISVFLSACTLSPRPFLFLGRVLSVGALHILARFYGWVTAMFSGCRLFLLVLSIEASINPSLDLFPSFTSCLWLMPTPAVCRLVPSHSTIGRYDMKPTRLIHGHKSLSHEWVCEWVSERTSERVQHGEASIAMYASNAYTSYPQCVHL